MKRPLFQIRPRSGQDSARDAAPALRGFRHGDDTGNRKLTCLYCGKTSSITEIREYARQLFGGDDSQCDFCPHCIKVDPFTAKGERGSVRNWR